MRAKLVDSILLTAIVASAMLAVIAVFGSGIYTSAYGIRLSSQTLWRPVLIASAATLWLLYRSDRRQQKLEYIWSRIVRHSTAAAIVLGAIAVAIAFRVSAFEAFGADAYGYVSQAHLWTAGSLVQHEPLSLRVPWPEPEWTFSPLGYRPGVERGTIVPSYPPGLPLMMAGLLLLFGRDGPFFVVPLLGGVAVITAFLLGRRVAGDVCGLATAALLLTSPVFLFQLKEPMSDVPVTALWLLAILLASATRPALIFSGGVATSAALLTRPNLVPLAAVLAMFVLLCSAKAWRTRLMNACLFAAAVAPGCIAVALVNNKLYGSPLSSGYGDTSALFNVNYFGTNLSQFSRWLLEMETPFILLAAAGWYVLRQGERRFSGLIAGFAAVVYGCYAVYLPFDNWTFLRFLLPAIALLLLLCGVALAALAERLPSFPARILAACFIVFLAWRWDVMGLKPLTPHDRRYAVIGEYVHDHLPPNAIVFSMLHSGSIRYYSGRLTFRWDWLPAEWLDRSIEFFNSHGYRPFLLVEQGPERTQFVQRFAGHSSIGSLKDLTPVATYHGGTRADLYDVGNPNQETAGVEIRPR